MSDRQTQAIFAAIKAFNGGTNTADVNARHGFMAGVEWADANPQPHTITRAMAMRMWLSGEYFVDMLRAVGIEVTDDD